MKYALNLAEDGRILSVTFEQYAPADSVLVEELPGDNVTDYRYVDGSFVYDPLSKPEESDSDYPTVWDELDAAYQEGVDSV